MLGKGLHRAQLPADQCCTSEPTSKTYASCRGPSCTHYHPALAFTLQLALKNMHQKCTVVSNTDIKDFCKKEAGLRGGRML